MWMSAMNPAPSRATLVLLIGNARLIYPERDTAANPDFADVFSGGRLAVEPGILPGGTSSCVSQIVRYLRIAEKPGVPRAADAPYGSQHGRRQAKHIRFCGAPSLRCPREIPGESSVALTFFVGFRLRRALSSKMCLNKTAAPEHQRTPSWLTPAL